METDLYWQAVRARDARFDGAFVFAVKTTGIFCKPSCSARRPLRENVQFFAGIEPAEAGGFRACMRCRPKLAGGIDPQVSMIIKACEMIDAADQISLDGLADGLGISPSHLQRTFKDLIGVSPKKYASARRAEHFKAELRAGSDVVTAMYEAGYGSSSRLYEKASERLGMTPAAYKKGGKGMNINYIIAECGLGKLLVARTQRGICSVTFGDTDQELAAGLRAEFPNASITEDGEGLRTAADAILQYLAGKNKRLILPLDLQATAFQMQVWDLLTRIPYGETRSYTEIAEQMGDRKKVRAVASACARNKVAMVIPCHRVIAGNGKLSGYRWGLERKASLLKMEKPD